MKNKLKCALLIDDDDINSMVIGMLLQQSNCVEKIAYFKNGNDALDYLKSDDQEIHPKPELIMLDIAMPIMSGWDFMEAYKKEIILEKKPIITIFSSSVDGLDREKADSIPEIHDFIRKPLDYIKIESILRTHFPDRV